MSALRHVPLGPRGSLRPARRSNWWAVAILAIAALELVGTVALAVPAGPGSVSAATPKASAAPAVTPAADPTHGDLNVTDHETYYIPGPAPPAVPSTYFQGGNITVEAGGTLIVQNVTLSFVQFVGDTGTPLSRLSHIFRFVIRAGGTAIFRNATLTTDAFLVNPYLKIDVVDNGTLMFYHSYVEAPGFLDVGTGGNLTLNASSALAPNPDASGLVLEPQTVGDLVWAPTLNISGGGSANLYGSTYTDLYADNSILNGPPDPLPLLAENLTVAPGDTVTSFPTPTDPGSLIQDYLYPSGVLGGNVTISYFGSLVGNTTLTATLNYYTSSFTLGTFTAVIGKSGTVVYDFPTALNALINRTGTMGWLNATGDFGGTAHDLSITFTGAGPAIGVSVIDIQALPPLAYGTSVVGSGSTLTTVDSFIGLDFAPLTTDDWGTHQLTLYDDATAYLANLTVAGYLQNGSSQAGYGAIVPDASSHAYLYRWTTVNAYGRGGVLPLPNATVSVYYAYNSSQANNATANGLNNLTLPAHQALWNYVQYWDSLHGVTTYGTTTADGTATVLVASNNIYGASAPDGDYLGDYHVVVTPPAGLGPAQTFSALVSSYPAGVANSSAGYGAPDFLGSRTFPAYFAQAALSSHDGLVVTAANVTVGPTTKITIGQELGVTVNVTDVGTAPITHLNATLYYNESGRVVLATKSMSTDLRAPGDSALLPFPAWQINDTVVGLLGGPVNDTLFVVVVWNEGLPVEGGGNFTTNDTIQISPSNVQLLDVLFPSTTLTANTDYRTTGYLLYNGSQAATVRLVAIPSGGGTPIVLGSSSVQPAKFEGHKAAFTIVWSSGSLAVGKAYQFSVLASYNSVGANDTPKETFMVPAPPVTHFFFEKFAGLPIWLWIVIAALVVAAAVGFLMFSRQRAAGKLVECGECGNLVPEDSKVCPKCGAEFESDVVRCSRCSSTIPANSRFCPECAAQLLGKPGEEAPDPERQAYADFTERFRAEAKKELGDNYSEGGFWDWWKRQPSYTPFSQWKVQQGQGTPRTGMTAPPPGSPPPGGAAPGAPAPRRAAAAPPSRPPSSGAARAAPAAAVAAPPPPAEAPPAPVPSSTAAGALKPCPNCGKEIPPEYLVCPFCGSVTQ